MREWQGKRYWLVGASEGLGRALALQVSKAGATVILSARNEERLNELAAEMPGRTIIQPMDVSDGASVAAAAEAVGDVDGIVYLAGAYWPMKATAWDPEQSVAMIDVNLTGAARVLGHIVPKMVEKGAGHIVLTGSLSGFRGLPGAIGYGASKAGLMSLAETMRIDLRGTGVEVQLANPGFIKTRLTDKNSFEMPGLMLPEEAAREMFELMCDDIFKKNFPGWFSLFFRGSQLLPDWAYFPLFKRAS